ncbi:MAG: type II toxin-antitoxin system RelE/ParE family toxin [Rhizobiales bacterium]|nr:type II toxin-antitoxin system RelE/ParE family toxin [Hyphomicrobiales bacterium]MDQ3558849.1 type II toxin-antitoxin system RelE/ParE family toxin [Pseudomonadota bacterium]
MSRDVIYRPAAEADLKAIYDYIARDSRENALRFLERIRTRADSLSDFPQRGTRRDDVSPGLRTFGIERRVTIVFRVTSDSVEIVNVLYGGRDIELALRSN